MNLFEQYGIKEVADVTLFEINADGTEKPVLFLDSLKVSTLEQTATQTEAKGGKGNSPLIIWDYGKEITINLEDALYSPRSMQVMYGNFDATFATATTQTITKTMGVTVVTADSYPAVKFIDVTTQSEVTVTGVTAAGLKYFDDAGVELTAASGLVAGEKLIAKWTQTVKNASKIVITAEKFPGTYKLQGDTYARSKNTGKDEYFMFIVNRAKMGAENNLTLQAEGDPTVFNMKMRVLRPDDGKMIELIQYQID